MKGAAKLRASKGPGEENRDVHEPEVVRGGSGLVISPAPHVLIAFVPGHGAARLRTADSPAQNAAPAIPLTPAKWETVGAKPDLPVPAGQALLGVYLLSVGRVTMWTVTPTAITKRTIRMAVLSTATSAEKLIVTQSSPTVQTLTPTGIPRPSL